MSKRPGRLVGVGVGPGDPELMTTLALRVIRESDRVVAPTTGVDAPGRAESIVREAVPGARMERVVFDMGDAAGDENRRQASYQSAAGRLVGWVDEGEQVCFVTLGDPNIYSTFSSLAAHARKLRPDLEVSTVPGIMAFQALAARSGSVLLQGTEPLSLVTALAGPEALTQAALDPGRALVIYKGGKHLPEIAKRLESAGRSKDALVGELLGLPGERIEPLNELRDGPASYLVTVIVPPEGRS